MKPQEITEKLRSALKEHGFESSIASAEHIPPLRDTIKESISTNLIDAGVRRQLQEEFDQMLDEDISWVRSIIVVAIPEPILEVLFTFEGKQHPVIIPPTYENSKDESVAAVIEAELIPHGYRVIRGTLPEKLLATSSGLARYGKNNISYVEGMGSFYRPLVYYTDLPLMADTWIAPQMLDECAGCKACTTRCPTGAIEPDRFRLRAERCLTYHNESSGAFQSWIDDSWHHCLIGCMRCQDCCPANKNVRSWKVQYAEFNEEETGLLLNGTSVDNLPPSLTAKLRDTILLNNPQRLARNLRSLLA